jgi:hypothetical protein
MQATGNDEGVTVLGGAIVLIGIVDGWVVSNFGGGTDESKKKALGHWNGTLIIFGWLGLRLWKAIDQN